MGSVGRRFGHIVYRISTKVIMVVSCDFFGMHLGVIPSGVQSSFALQGLGLQTSILSSHF